MQNMAYKVEGVKSFCLKEKGKDVKGRDEVKKEKRRK